MLEALKVRCICLRNTWLNVAGRVVERCRYMLSIVEMRYFEQVFRFYEVDFVSFEKK